MGHNRAGANRRERMRRRRNLERIWLETRCWQCQTDCRKEKMIVMRDIRTRSVLSQLCQDCDVRGMMPLYERHGLIQGTLLDAADRTLAYRNATEEERMHMRPPALTDAQADLVLAADKRVTEKFLDVIRDERVRMRLSGWYFELPRGKVFAGGTDRFRFELRKLKKKDVLFCDIIDCERREVVCLRKHVCIGTDERSVRIRIELKEEGSELLLETKIGGLYCTEAEFVTMMEWFVDANPECKRMRKKKIA